MPAPKGNNYWEFREKHGRDHKYQPEALGEECVAYCDWIKANPLKEQKGFAFKGTVTKKSFNKMRAMTITGFCLFADAKDADMAFGIATDANGGVGLTGTFRFATDLGGGPLKFAAEKDNKAPPTDLYVARFEP